MPVGVRASALFPGNRPGVRIAPSGHGVAVLPAGPGIVVIARGVTIAGTVGMAVLMDLVGATGSLETKKGYSYHLVLDIINAGYSQNFTVHS